MCALLLVACLSLVPFAGSAGVDVPPQAFLPTPMADNVAFTLSAEAHADSKPDPRADDKSDIRTDDKPDRAADDKPDTRANNKPAAAPEPLLLPLVRKRVVVRTRHEICKTVARAATTNDLPIPFFIRF